MKPLATCIVTAALLLSSCGMPDPAVQLQDETESPEEKPPTSWQQRVGQGALVIGGVVAASCLLVVKVHRLCARIVISKQQTKGLSQQMNEVVLVSDSRLLRHEDTIAQLQDKVATLQRESEELNNFVRSTTSKQATLNGSFFEHDTVHDLYEIIPNLYQGEQVNKIFRNIDGYFSNSSYSKDKDFEIDAIVVTANRVFVIETKVTLTRKGVDRFVALLKKFPQLKFDNEEVYAAVKNKPVHGGFSYRFDAKLEAEEAIRDIRTASRYAKEHNMLTIPRLTDYKSEPKEMNKLRDFQVQQQ